MTSTNLKAAEDTTEREIVITRVFAAPRDLVWKAWTDPDQVVKWWGPQGFTNTLFEMDVRPGGVWRHMMHGPDGTDYPNKVVFREVVKPGKLVYSLGDGVEGSPCQFHVTVKFDDMGKDNTKVTLRMLFETREQCQETINFGAIEGGNQTLGRLAKHMEEILGGPKTFTLIRSFDAPRDLVWKAWTDPELFGKWFGPKGFTSKVHRMELRPGGVLHSCLTSADGQEMWAKFVYREVTPPAKLSWEHSFSDKDGNITRHPGHAAWPLTLLTTVSFGAVGEKTTITLTWVPFNATEAERKAFEDGIPGMNQGWGGTFEQLDEFLRETRSGAR